SGKITSGPFVRGPHVGCILDHRELVWIDPAKDKPLWTHRTTGKRIVGQPQIAGDLLVVADVNGLVVGLDPATGKPAWKAGYTIQANAAPAATPVAYGPDHIFAPLTDGTVLLLPLKSLRPQGEAQ